jgi:ABC-type transport system substrate-binding protein
MQVPELIAFVGAGKHDQMGFWMGTGMQFSPNRAISVYQSTNTMYNWTFNNDSNYDALVKQFQDASTLDEAKRLSIEAERYALEQHWTVNTFPLAGPLFWQPWIKGYSGQVISSTQSPAYFLARWWIDQDLKKSMGH